MIGSPSLAQSGHVPFAQLQSINFAIRVTPSPRGRSRFCGELKDKLYERQDFLVYNSWSSTSRMVCRPRFLALYYCALAIAPFIFSSKRNTFRNPANMSSTAAFVSSTQDSGFGCCTQGHEYFLNIVFAIVALG